MINNNNSSHTYTIKSKGASKRWYELLQLNRDSRVWFWPLDCNSVKTP